MKTKEEIRQLANKFAKQFDYAEDSSPFLYYIEGYTQCQLDMADKKYTEEDVRHIIYKGFRLGIDRGFYSKELEDKLINSLNKQD